MFCRGIFPIGEAVEGDQPDIGLIVQNAAAAISMPANCGPLPSWARGPDTPRALSSSAILTGLMPSAYCLKIQTMVATCVKHDALGGMHNNRSPWFESQSPW